MVELCCKEAAQNTGLFSPEEQGHILSALMSGTEKPDRIEWYVSPLVKPYYHRVFVVVYWVNFESKAEAQVQGYALRKEADLILEKFGIRITNCFVT
jgi:hypothetical protein